MRFRCLKITKVSLNNPTKAPPQGLPPGSGALFFIQVFAMPGFAVLYSTLVLYATKRLGFSEAQANATMGVFGAFNHGLHLFGGYLGGRFLSNRNALCWAWYCRWRADGGCWAKARAGFTGDWRCS